MNIDVVTCSVDDERYAAMRANFEQMLGEHLSLSFTRISDAKSMAEGYERGSALGSADWVIFCHDDVAVIDVDLTALTASMQALDVIGVCGSTLCQSPNWYLADPSNLRGRVVAPDRRVGYVLQTFGEVPKTHCAAQALDGLFLLVKRSILDRVTFSAEVTGFTCYDVDFTYRAHLAGHRVGTIGSLLLFHNSRVEEFPEAKIRQWSLGQRHLARKFNFWRSFPDHSRHRTVPFDARLMPPGSASYRPKRRA
jgi:GT2 family glycosyltransferase